MVELLDLDLDDGGIGIYVSKKGKYTCDWDDGMNMYMIGGKICVLGEFSA